MASIHAFDAIRSFVEANWSDTAPRPCPLAWDNEPITKPEPYGPADPGTGAATINTWGRVLVDGDLWSQESIGTGDPASERWDETGSVMVFVFAPVDGGSRLNREVLTAFAEMCRWRDANGIEFQDIRFDPIGAKDESGNWWGMHIVIDWIRRG